MVERQVDRAMEACASPSHIGAVCYMFNSMHGGIDAERQGLSSVV